MVCLLLSSKTAQNILQNAACFTRHFDPNLQTQSICTITLLVFWKPYLSMLSERKLCKGRE